MKLGPYLLGPNDENQGIYTGDARILSEAIPDESVDLIFTDPVYQNIEDYRWLAETAVRVLKPDMACLAFCGVGELDLTIAAMKDGGMTYRWQIPLYRANQQNFMYAPCGRSKYSPLLWFDVNGASRVRTKVCDIRKVTFPDTALKGFGWSKPPSFVLHYLSAFLGVGLAFDPFTGGGTVPAVCKILGCQWLAFEIDPEVAEQARQRVDETQPPLFVPKPQQIAFELEGGSN